MSGSAEDNGPFRGVTAGENELQQAIADLRGEIESLQRLEPLFVEGTALLRVDIQSLRSQLAELPAGGGPGAIAAELPGLRAELRNTLREATEHLRTLVVEEVNELRGELQGVRARLNDRRSQDRADLRTSLAAGSDTLRAALAEDAAGVRAELEAVRAQLKEQQVADQQLLRAELRAALREWNEHLRTRIVEEATELRSELHQVRGQLTDQQTQHRSDLKAAMGEGSGQVLTALAEATSALQTEVAFLRDQLPTREMVGAAIAQQEQLRNALLAEIERLLVEVRTMPVSIEEQRAGDLEATRAAVQEGSQAAEASFAQHAERLLAEMQTLLAQHEARHGDEGQQLRAIVAAGTENLRAAVLAETATARSSLVDHSERLRAEIQAVWAHFNDQHAEERAELTSALAESTDFVRGALRREVEAIGTGLAATQAAAQDELASLRGRVEAFSALYTNAQATARMDLSDLRDHLHAVGAQLGDVQAGVRAEVSDLRDQIQAVGAQLGEAASTGRTDVGELRDEIQALLIAAQAAARADVTELREHVQALNIALAAAQEGSGATRVQLDALGMDLTAAQATARHDADRLAARLDQGFAELSAVTRDTHLDSGEQLRAAVVAEAAATRDSLVNLAKDLQAAAAEQAAADRDAMRATLVDETAATRDSLVERAERLHTAVVAESGSTRDALLVMADQLRAAAAAEAASTRDELLELTGQLRAASEEQAASIRDELLQLTGEFRAASEEQAASTRDALVERAERLRAAVAEEAAATRESLVEQSKHLRAEVQTVWGQLNDQHGAERQQLEDTVRETSERLRASLLVELTEFIQAQVEALAGANQAALAEQVGQLRAAVDDADRQAERERVVHEVTAAGERLAAFQQDLEAWQQLAAEERTSEVDALLAAVAGNEERLHQLMSTELAEADRRRAHDLGESRAEADRRRNEDREEMRAAFVAAAEEHQAQVAYLEAALQTFNQALALERDEVRALVTWSQEATDASVAELSGRLDAQGRMLSRLMAGEGVLEVSEAVAALRDDIARLSRKVPAKPKNSPSDEAHTAKRAARKAPTAPAPRRRPTRPS